MQSEAHNYLLRSYHPLLLTINKNFFLSSASKVSEVTNLGKHIFLFSRAMLQYTLDGNTYDMYHTFTPPSFRGSGVARLLAYKAFDHVADSGAKMKLTCSYLDHLHNKELNPKYDPHVVKSSSPV